MTLAEAIAALRAYNEEVPRPMRLPSEEEVRALEATIGTTLHPDYVRYLLEASDVVFRTLEPATITIPDSYRYLPSVIADARSAGVPEELLPFCEDNGDFFCLTQDGGVRFWSHDGGTAESWGSLGEWIQEVWLTN